MTMAAVNDVPMTNCQRCPEPLHVIAGGDRRPGESGSCVHEVQWRQERGATSDRDRRSRPGTGRGSVGGNCPLYRVAHSAEPGGRGGPRNLPRTDPGCSNLGRLPPDRAVRYRLPTPLDAGDLRLSVADELNHDGLGRLDDDVGELCKQRDDERRALHIQVFK